VLTATILAVAGVGNTGSKLCSQHPWQAPGAAKLHALSLAASVFKGTDCSPPSLLNQDLTDPAAYPEPLQQLEPSDQQQCAMDSQQDLQTLVLAKQLSSIDKAFSLMRGHQ
jgi:hypothetical protein